MRKINKKKPIIMFLTGALIVSTISFSGCSIGKDREQEEAYRSEGIAAYKAGDYQTAIEKFDLALEESNGDTSELETDIIYYKAKALVENKDPESAIAIYDSILEEDPSDSDTWYLRGCASLAAGLIEQADTDFARAVQNAPNDYELTFAVYQAFKNADQPEKANAALEQALAFEEESEEDLCRKGYICYLLNDTDQANSYLAQAIEEGSDQAVLYQGMIYAQTGQREDAVAMFDRYASEHEDDEKEMLDLAAAAEGGGLYEDAIRYYSALREMEDADGQAVLKGLIASYEGSGDYDTAYTLLEEYLQSWPDDEEAQKELTFVQTRR
jgi:tetratricopeptide (TPR) repeat protein